MSFFSAIKNAFGFGPDNELDSELPDIDADQETASDDVDLVSDDMDVIEGLSDVPTLPEIEPDMKARIFDGAVAIFNEALPDFLKKSVDPDAQAKRLAEALDKGVDDYLSGIMLRAEQYAEAKLKGATESARRESEKLRSDMQQIEQQRSSLREQQLSADRRRRALADRVTDLEAQLASVEAEREQFELENRSLLNKLKVADVQPGVVEEMAKEIEQLKARLEGAQLPGEDAVKIDPAEFEEAKSRAEKLTAEIKDLRTQQEMAQAMYNDLQNQYAAERETRLNVEKSLDEARKVVDGVAEIQAQMSQVEEIIRKRDERIAKLKSSNKKLREQLAAAEEAAARAASRDDGLFSIPAEPVRQNPAFSPDAMAAIEDEFECPEWFVSTPAPGEVSPLLASDAEFGYQEPPKKARKPENDAQLSLF